MALSNKELSSINIGDYIYYKGKVGKYFTYGKAYKVENQDKMACNVTIKDDHNITTRINLETGEDFIYHHKKNSYSLANKSGLKFGGYVALNIIVSLFVQILFFYDITFFMTLLIFVGSSLFILAILTLFMIADTGVGTKRNTSTSYRTSNNALNKPKEVKCSRCGSKQFSANKRGFSATGAIIGGVIGGFAGSQKVIVTCLSCGHSWKAGKQ